MRDVSGEPWRYRGSRPSRSAVDVLDEDELKVKAKALAKACGEQPLLLSAAVGKGMTEALRALRSVIVAAKAGEGFGEENA